MKPNFLANRLAVLATAGVVLWLLGCASTDGTPAGGSASSRPTQKVKAPDGRTIDIGRASPASGGGTNYKNPHMDRCWVADGFDFNGYDTIYVAPTLSTAKFNPKDEVMPHELAKENLVSELARTLKSVNLFPNVVTKESDLNPAARTLKLENTIIEYAKGGGGARYFAGLYGGGQPVLRVGGKMTDGVKTVFTFEARRSGVSAGARMGGAFMKDVDIQLEDIRSLTLDLTDFMCVIAKKPAVNTK